MSPEQARGQAADARSDIFSFGALLHELITGRRAFERPTVPETMTAILREEPPPVSSAVALPPVLERVITRCLEKVPGDRFQNARDLAFAIENSSLSSATSAVIEGADTAPRRFGVLLGGQERRLIGNVTEAAAAPTPPARLTFVRGSASDPDGTKIGILDEATGAERILFRILGWDLLGLSWSSDARSIAVTRATAQGTASGFRVLPIDVATDVIGDIAGFPARVVRYDTRDGDLRTLFWAPGLFPLRGSSAAAVRFAVLEPGQIAFDAYKQEERLMEVRSPDDRMARPLTDGTSADRQPAYSPDGRSIIFASNRTGNLDIWTVDLQLGGLRQITDDPARDWDPAFTPDGRHVLFSSDRTGALEVWIADADGGNARQVTRDGVDAENPTQTRDGRYIVYSSSNPDHPGIWRIGPDGAGAARLVAANYILPEVSPDGRHALYATIDNSALRNTIRVMDVETGKPADFRIDLPFGPMSANVTYGRSRWLPDGREVAFVGLDERGRTGVYAQEFGPGRDTTTTRRRRAGFEEHLVTESFGIAPDAKRVIYGAIRETRQLMLAEGVAGVN
jgi:dipeptidyl aminopeptidase/acylaminoacyl peptidase